MNAELEYAGKTYGFQNPEYDTMGVSDLQKQLNIVNNEISDIQKKIQNKQAEIESIKAGTNLSDLDKVAREEYVRTGSSAAMQSLENSRLSKEMTAKTQADIDEQTLNDTEAEADNLKYIINTLYGTYLDQGNSLSNVDKEKVNSALASLKKLSIKRKNVPDDIDKNGIEDTIEKRASDAQTGSTTHDVKVAPENNEELATAINQLKTEDDKNLIKTTYIKSHDNWYTNGLVDIDKIPIDETISREFVIAGKHTKNINSTSTKTNETNAVKAKEKSLNALKATANGLFAGGLKTKENWKIIKQLPKTDELRKSISSYNEKYDPDITIDNLVEVK